MNTSSPEVSERANKIQSAILRAISLTGQNHTADEIKVSPPTISRWLSDEDNMKRCCKILAAIGLKVVPQTVVCVSQRTYEAYKHLAAEHMRTVSREEQLSWDE